MTPEVWFGWIKVAAFVSGLVLGGFAIGSTSWVWLKKNVLTIAAGWLATLGTVMIGMSIWQSVVIKGPGWEARFSELEQRAAHLQARYESSQKELAELREKTTQIAQRASQPGDIVAAFQTGSVRNEIVSAVFDKIEAKLEATGMPDYRSLVEGLQAMDTKVRKLDRSVDSLSKGGVTMIEAVEAVEGAGKWEPAWGMAKQYFHQAANK